MNFASVSHAIPDFTCAFLYGATFSGVARLTCLPVTVMFLRGSIHFDQVRRQAIIGWVSRHVY